MTPEPSNPRTPDPLYSSDELDYARERVAIMVHDGGLEYADARKEVEKMIEKRRTPPPLSPLLTKEGMGEVMEK